MTDDERDRRFKGERKRQARRQAAIQRDTAAEIKRLLREAEATIKARLAAQLSEFDQWRLPELRRSIENALAEFEDGATGAFTSGTGKAWQAGIDLVDAPVAAGGVEIRALLTSVDTRQLEAMRTFLTGRVRDISLKAANAINGQLGLVVAGAQDAGRATTAVTKILRQNSRKRAITIVRTEVGRAYAVAAQERKDQAARVLPGLKKEWRRSGKVFSRPDHDAADGQVVAVGESFIVAGEELMHPRDPAGSPSNTINCGCQSLPFMESW